MFRAIYRKPVEVVAAIAAWNVERFTAALAAVTRRLGEPAEADTSRERKKAK